MQLWRLVRPEYAPGLDGQGARRAGGRWNSPGVGVVYCTTSLSLAVLEVFVHLPPVMRSRDKLPRLTAVALTFPQDLPMHDIRDDDLPAAPDIADYRAIGDEWAAGGDTLAMSVPSLVVPRERNVILNPAHRDMGKVVVAESFAFRLDPRLGL